MNPIVGTIQDGQVVFDSQVDWPDGTRVELHPVPATAADQPPGDQLDQLMDEMADIVDAASEADRTGLSDYAVSRQGIYGDHL